MEVRCSGGDLDPDKPELISASAINRRRAPVPDGYGKPMFSCQIKSHKSFQELDKLMSMMQNDEGFRRAVG